MNNYVIARYRKGKVSGFVVVDLNGRIANDHVHKTEQEAEKHLNNIKGSGCETCQACKNRS